MNDVQPTSSQPTVAPTRVAIVVLGMHRSGTSALSGFIHLLGAAAPRRMNDPNSFNAKGYWESAPIQEFNDRLLAAAGSSWRDWSPFDIAQLGPRAAEWEAELSDLIKQEFRDSSLFVLKDPRFCRLAPFLFGVLDRLKITPRIVVPVRNPIEIALSLHARDQMLRDDALLLWLRHVLEAEKQSRGRPRCIVAYDDLLRDWRNVARRLGHVLALTWPDRSPEADREVDAFLTGDLRHHSAAEDEAPSPIGKWTMAVYEILGDLSRSGELTDEQAARLDSIRTLLDEVTPMFYPITRSRDEMLRDRRKELEAARKTALKLKRLRKCDMLEHEQELESLQRRLDTALAGNDRLERDLIRLRVELHKALTRPRGILGSEILRRAMTGAWKSADQEDLAALIESSGLFDRDWYVARYPDVPATGLEPMLHYLRHGAAAGRDPSPRFSTSGYLGRYPDVAPTGMNPLVHFLELGLTEGRQFDPASQSS